MNKRITQFLLRRGARFPFLCLFVFGLLACFFVGWLTADEQPAEPGLIAHEWGTFTAVAGNDGRAAEWTPTTGSTDLPGFVEHFSDVNFKSGLRGTIRMETPVLYFYTSHDLTVSVKVAFAKGVISEWYPHATRVQPDAAISNTNLSELKTDGTIVWNQVTLLPSLRGEFPRERLANRYYAARETSATPLRIKTAMGEQREKFLFYRGVSAVALPLVARLSTNGNLLVKNLNVDAIPTLIFFERRGDHMGYRVVREPSDETLLEPPVLTDDLDSLRTELEGILTSEGLYADEAQAMVETWRDSWFEEGSRLIYIVPRAFLDMILPLAINPRPEQVLRVFVGRLEIVTPATADAVETALASKDVATLSKYGRFLEPIHRMTMEKHTQATR